MKKILFSVALLLIAANVFASIATKSASPTKRYDIYTSTFGNSSVDTIKWVREEGVSAISIGLYVADTMDVSATTAIYRIVNGVAVTALAADTLANIEALTATDYLVPKAALDAVTLAPLADQYWFVITYHSSGNGTGTANTVRYRIYKQYAK